MGRYGQKLVKLLSLSSALQQAQHKKLALQQQLQTLTWLRDKNFWTMGIYFFADVQSESLSRKNEFDEISERVEDRKLVMGNMLMDISFSCTEKTAGLPPKVGSLYVLDSGKLLAGEMGVS
ncbi:putative glutamate--cysteine ligase 2-1 [Bienertia sinuspersici]